MAAASEGCCARDVVERVQQWGCSGCRISKRLAEELGSECTVQKGQHIAFERACIYMQLRHKSVTGGRLRIVRKLQNRQTYMLGLPDVLRLHHMRICFQHLVILLMTALRFDCLIENV